MSRLGIIVPDDGPLDCELYRLEPWFVHRGIDVKVSTEDSFSPGFVYADGPEEIEASLKHTGSDEVLLPCAQRLVEQQCEVILWACTSGSFAGGYQWARDQTKRLRRESDRPCTSTTLALIEAVHALDTREVDLLSTYPQFATQRLTETLADAGIEVVDSTSVDGATDHSFGKQADFSYQLNILDVMREFFDPRQPRQRAPDPGPQYIGQHLEAGRGVRKRSTAPGHHRQPGFGLARIEVTRCQRQSSRCGESVRSSFDLACMLHQSAELRASPGEVRLD